MILKKSDKVLIVHRRLFENDYSRFFLGTVDAYETGVARVTGFTSLYIPFEGSFFVKDEQRTKIFSISSGTLIVYLLPKTIDLKTARVESTREGSLTLVDK